MDRLCATCCGLDVPQATVVACLLRPAVAAGVGAGTEDGRQMKEVRSFPTTTEGLLALRDWLAGVGCSHVAMEGTGV